MANSCDGVGDAATDALMSILGIELQVFEEKPSGHPPFMLSCAPDQKLASSSSSEGGCGDLMQIQRNERALRQRCRHATRALRLITSPPISSSQHLLP